MGEIVKEEYWSIKKISKLDRKKSPISTKGKSYKLISRSTKTAIFYGKNIIDTKQRENAVKFYYSKY